MFRFGRLWAPIVPGGPGLVQVPLVSSALSHMRLATLGLLALAFAVPSQAQDAPATYRPSLRSTFVVPAHNGEAVRITTYARRPPERGRLARRYRGLRANRTVRMPHSATPARVVQRTVSTPRHSYVRVGGTYYQVVPGR